MLTWCLLHRRAAKAQRKICRYTVMSERSLLLYATFVRRCGDKLIHVYTCLHIGFTHSFSSDYPNYSLYPTDIIVTTRHLRRCDLANVNKIVFGFWRKFNGSVLQFSLLHYMYNSRVAVTSSTLTETFYY